MDKRPRKGRAKRRERAEEALAIEEAAVAEEAVSPEPEAAKATGAPEPQVGYTMSEWKGLKQWRCNLCPWDTLAGEEEMMAHIASAHLPRPARTKTVTLPLVDRFGNLVETEVEDG